MRLGAAKTRGPRVPQCREWSGLRNSTAQR